MGDETSGKSGNTSRQKKHEKKRDPTHELAFHDKDAVGERRENDIERAKQQQKSAVDRALDMFGADSGSEHDVKPEQSAKIVKGEGRTGADDEAHHASSSTSHERSKKKKKKDKKEQHASGAGIATAGDREFDGEIRKEQTALDRALDMFG